MITASRFISLFERNDVENVRRLDQDARAVMTKYLEKLGGILNQLFPVRKSQVLKTYDLNNVVRDISTLDYNGVHFVFTSGFTNGKQRGGLFQSKTKDTIAKYLGKNVITITNPVFSKVGSIREYAYYYAEPKMQRQRASTRAKAVAFFNEVKEALTNDELMSELHNILDMVVHELTHHEDSEKHTLDTALDRQNAMLAKKGKITSDDINKAYMGSTFEYNAYFNNSLAFAMRMFRKVKPEDFNEFMDVVISGMGKNHWDLIPDKNKRKIRLRTYDAYTKLFQ